MNHLTLLILIALLAGPAAAQTPNPIPHPRCTGTLLPWEPLIDATSGVLEICVPLTWKDGSAFPPEATGTFSCEFTQSGTRLPDITGLSPGELVPVSVTSVNSSDPTTFLCQIKTSSVWVAGDAVNAALIFPGAAIGEPGQPDPL